MIKIVADSSCDIRDIGKLADDLKLEFVPLKILVGDREFVDDDTIDINEMYKALAEYDGKTSTACPSPEEYDRAFEDADEIYVITISSSLSGSYNAANIAKEMQLEKYPDKKIFVLDSFSTSGTMALAMYKINELVKKGVKFENICEEVVDYVRNHTHLDFVLHSVANLVRNGRLNKIIGSAINVLGIKLVGRASVEGTLEPFGKGRGTSKIIKNILAEMKDTKYTGGNAISSHANNLSDVTQLKDAIIKEYPNADVEIVESKGLVAYYEEEKGIIIGFEY